MAAPPRSADLAAASAKLADEARSARHGEHFKIRLTSSDGRPATVTWQIDTHRAEALPYVLRTVAQQLRVKTPEEAYEVLMTWDRDRLIDHLGQFTHAELRPPSMRR